MLKPFKSATFKLASACLIAALVFSQVSFAVSDSIDVIDLGERNDGKIQKIQVVPRGETRIAIERDGDRRILRITIDQRANITRSGSALEISNLLADLIEGDTVAENLIVLVEQNFTLSGEIKATGIRFSDTSARNSRLLKGIDLRVIQNLPLVAKGQVWTPQTYAMALIHDFAGLQEVALSLASGTPSGRSLGDVASFPGANGLYEKITLGGKVALIEGTINHIGIEKASVVPFPMRGDCSSLLGGDQ